MPTWLKSKEFLFVIIYVVGESENPSTYAEALSSSESDSQLNAIKEEMAALHENKTYKFVERHKGSKKKFNSDGIVEKYRVCLVEKGDISKKLILTLVRPSSE